MQRMSRTFSLLLATAVAFSMPAIAEDNAAKDAKADTKATQDAKALTKISEADARKTALASVSNGTVQSSKLVTDKGRQVWAFDLKGESSPNVVVVQVDANSGRIVSKSIKPATKAKKS